MDRRRKGRGARSRQRQGLRDTRHRPQRSSQSITPRQTLLLVARHGRGYRHALSTVHSLQGTQKHAPQRTINPNTSPTAHGTHVRNRFRRGGIQIREENKVPALIRLPELVELFLPVPETANVRIHRQTAQRLVPPQLLANGARDRRRRRLHIRGVHPLDEEQRHRAQIELARPCTIQWDGRINRQNVQETLGQVSNFRRQLPLSMELLDGYTKRTRPTVPHPDVVRKSGETSFMVPSPREEPCRHSSSVPRSIHPP